MTDYMDFLEIDLGLSTEFKLYSQVQEVIRHPATVKRIVGKRIVESNVSVPTLEDVDMQVDIYLFGTDEGSLNTLALATEETTFLALNDIGVHTVDFGKYSGNYYIQPESVKEDTTYNREHPDSRKYSVLFLQKNL